jgi:hypothetical protein
VPAAFNFLYLSLLTPATISVLLTFIIPYNMQRIKLSSQKKLKRCLFCEYLIQISKRRDKENELLAIGTLFRTDK